MYDEIKQQIVSALDELGAVRGELSALATNVEDVRTMLDEALRTVCGMDVIADADRLMMAREGKKEMDKQQKYLGRDYDF